MIVGGKNKETGKYVFSVYGADNRLFATVEGDDYQATRDRAYAEQRRALAPIMGKDILLNITDDEILDALK